jgi:hypothetical protein
MTVSTLHCVSFDPPWVSVALAHASKKSSGILHAGRFTARILRHGEEASALSGEMPEGPSLAEFECTIRDVHKVGDHDLVLATVEKVEDHKGRPLVYWRKAFHWLEVHYPFVESRRSLAQFVHDWETGKLPKPAWTHGAHVTMGAVYAIRYPGRNFEKMREGIRRFNDAVGTPNTDDSGYHETLTWLWANVIARVVEEHTDEWEAARHAVTLLGEDRDLHYLYYSFDVVRSVEARRNWMAPDLHGPFPLQYSAAV